jgi:hypothetical protein
MTQKEKLNKAMEVAMRVKSIARSLEFDAKDYDVSWPLHHVKDLNNLADNFLKLFK